MVEPVETSEAIVWKGYWQMFRKASASLFMIGLALTLSACTFGGAENEADAIVTVDPTVAADHPWAAEFIRISNESGKYPTA